MSFAHGHLSPCLASSSARYSRILWRTSTALILMSRSHNVTSTPCCVIAIATHTECSSTCTGHNMRACNLQAIALPSHHLIGHEDTDLHIPECHAPHLGPILLPNTDGTSCPVQLETVIRTLLNQPQVVSLLG